MAPFRWVEQIESELEAGAWKVIAEARESGSVGIFRHDGEVRQGLVDEILHAVDGSQIIFEAPRKEQQVWFVRRLGPDVNLGNIAPEEVLSLETVRRRAARRHRGRGARGRRTGPVGRRAARWSSRRH